MILNKIYNEHCFITMKRMIKDKVKVDNIITSPFYNTSRSTSCHIKQRARDNYEGRYDTPVDNMTNDEYLDFTLELFSLYDKILKRNGCILYNLSYGSENTELMWLVIAKIITETPFTIADDIIWKKQSALPNNVSSNKLTRIVEHIFVICRKDEFKTFVTNKQVKSVSDKTGQKFYENVFNLVEAPNNDGANKLNKATFSSELIRKLISIYVRPNSIIYDSFMGTGTTALACKQTGNKYIGSEISKAQCDYADERLGKKKKHLKKKTNGKTKRPLVKVFKKDSNSRGEK